MTRSRTAFFCSECGAETPKWAGQCPECGAWNALQEAPVVGSSQARKGGYTGTGGGLRLLRDVQGAEEVRHAIGIGELDRVLGGGLVQGGVVLVGGDPGIGKSTLLLQMLASVHPRLASVYVAGEESLQQIGLRARRLGYPDLGLALLAETSVEAVLQVLQRERPAVAVVDSIQTMFTETLQSAPGSVAQVRESAARLVRFAKQSGTALFLVGHVTKEGAIAGPRVLEHMVDTVLYFESDVGGRYRIVRAVKNRFGAVNELGVFAMGDDGLKPVSHPSAIFLSRHDGLASGSVVTCVREGSRPMLLEVQALVDDSQLANPRRVAVGLDSQRLALLLAVLHRHGGVSMAGQDVFMNVVGGVRISETAADLPVVLAALSSLRNRPIGRDTVAFGELGLAGELRPVSAGEDRLREAAKHGFARALVPKPNAPRRGARIGKMEVVAAATLAELLQALW